MTSVHFSSARDTWETPPELFGALDKVHRFTLDAAALPDTAKCPNYFTPADDSLAQVWRGRVWCNPPYGRQIARWVRKAYAAVYEAGTADLVVLLVPARVDTAWFQDYCARGSVWFVRGRVRFVGAKDDAPFPSAIVTFCRTAAPVVTWGAAYPASGGTIQADFAF